MLTTWDLYSARADAYSLSETNAQKFWDWLMDPQQLDDDEIDALGLRRIRQPINESIGDVAGELRKIEVHSVRPARRVSPNGVIHTDLVVEITQSFRPASNPSMRFRGGCTLLINLATAEVRYMVRKKVNSPARLQSQMTFGAAAGDGLHVNYFDGDPSAREPFAFMHGVYR
jgi:hypothetical protein